MPLGGPGSSRVRENLISRSVTTRFSFGLTWSHVIGLFATEAEATDVLHQQYPGRLFPILW